MRRFAKNWRGANEAHRFEHTALRDQPFCASTQFDSGVVGTRPFKRRACWTTLDCPSRFFASCNEPPRLRGPALRARCNWSGRNMVGTTQRTHRTGNRAALASTKIIARAHWNGGQSDDRCAPRRTCHFLRGDAYLLRHRLREISTLAMGEPSQQLSIPLFSDLKARKIIVDRPAVDRIPPDTPVEARTGA